MATRKGRLPKKKVTGYEKLREKYIPSRNGGYDRSIPWVYKLPAKDPKEKPVKEPEPKAGYHTLDDLRRIKELNDKIAILESRIALQHTTIKSLKRKVTKLETIIAAPEREIQDKAAELVENPEFLEIEIDQTVME
jgi:uncharacterized coiled-coil protein SlyX